MPTLGYTAKISVVHQNVQREQACGVMHVILRDKNIQVGNLTYRVVQTHDRLGWKGILVNVADLKQL